MNLRRNCFVAGALVALLFVPAARADDVAGNWLGHGQTISLGAPGEEPASSGKRPGVAESALGKGAQEMGFDFGGAKGMLIFGGRLEHDFLLGSAHYGWVFTDLVGRDRWYEGNFELRGELLGARQVSLERRYLGAFSPVLRYSFLASDRWVPFVDAGAGVALADIGAPDLSRGPQLDLQFGGGLQYFWQEHSAVTFEDRYLHVSNGRTHSPDLGLNTNLLTVGVSWFF